MNHRQASENWMCNARVIGLTMELKECYTYIHLLSQVKGYLLSMWLNDTWHLMLGYRLMIESLICNQNFKKNYSA